MLIERVCVYIMYMYIVILYEKEKLYFVDNVCVSIYTHTYIYICLEKKSENFMVQEDSPCMVLRIDRVLLILLCNCHVKKVAICQI